MKAIEFKEQVVVIAKDQKEYQPLPAWFGNGLVCVCFELDEEEKAKVLETKKAGIGVLNFNGPVQGMEVKTIKPEFPIDFRLALNCNPAAWDLENQTAVLEFEFGDDELEALEAEGLFWIIIAVRDSPLLPFNPQVL